MDNNCMEYRATLHYSFLIAKDAVPCKIKYRYIVVKFFQGNKMRIIKLSKNIKQPDIHRISISMHQHR